MARVMCCLVHQVANSRRRPVVVEEAGARADVRRSSRVVCGQQSGRASHEWEVELNVALGVQPGKGRLEECNPGGEEVRMGHIDMLGDLLGGLTTRRVLESKLGDDDLVALQSPQPLSTALK